MSRACNQITFPFVVAQALAVLALAVLEGTAQKAVSRQAAEASTTDAPAGLARPQTGPWAA